MNGVTAVAGGGFITSSLISAIKAEKTGRYAGVRLVSLI